MVLFNIRNLHKRKVTLPGKNPFHLQRERREIVRRTNYNKPTNLPAAVPAQIIPVELIPPLYALLHIVWSMTDTLTRSKELDGLPFCKRMHFDITATSGTLALSNCRNLP